jgi:hypothetical protein
LFFSSGADMFGASQSKPTPIRHSGLDPESRGFLPTVLDSGPGSESGVTFFRRNDKLTLIASQGK